MKTSEGIKHKYEIVGYYYLFKRSYIDRGTFDSIEACRKWAEEHKSKEILCGENVWKAAPMSSYTITEVVETRTVVEKKRVDGKRDAPLR